MQTHQTYNHTQITHIIETSQNRSHTYTRARQPRSYTCGLTHITGRHTSESSHTTQTSQICTQANTCHSIIRIDDTPTNACIHIFLQIHNYTSTNTQNATMHTQWTKAQVQNHTQSQELTGEARATAQRHTLTYTHVLTADPQTPNHTHTPHHPSRSPVHPGCTHSLSHWGYVTHSGSD